MSRIFGCLAVGFVEIWAESCGRGRCFLKVRYFCVKDGGGDIGLVLKENRSRFWVVVLLRSLGVRFFSV